MSEGGGGGVGEGERRGMKRRISQRTAELFLLSLSALSNTLSLRLPCCRMTMQYNQGARREREGGREIKKMTEDEETEV